MPDLERTEQTARRLLGLASLLAVAAAAILVVDFMITGQILKAEEVRRGLVGANRPDGVAGAGPGAHGLGDVADAAPADQGDSEGEELPAAVG